MVAGNQWINAHNVSGYGRPYGGVNSRQTYFDDLRHQTVARPEA